MFGVIIGIPVYNYGESFWLGDKLLGYHAVPLVGYSNRGFIIKIHGEVNGQIMVLQLYLMKK